MENIIKFNIGDYSRDGHGQSEMVTIKCNARISQLRDIYKRMIDDSGIYFGGLNWKGFKLVGIKWICSEYEDNVFDITDLKPMYRQPLIAANFDSYDDKNKLYLYDEQIIRAMMIMIKAFDERVEFEIVSPPDDEHLFNKWGCHGIGYGLYE